MKNKSIKKDRRDFIKKVAYSAPTLISLGALIRPKKANAFTTPPSGPNWD